MKLSTVFGSEDRFLNWIAEATSRLPFFPLVDGGNALVQPVYVNDVAKGLLEITKVRSTTIFFEVYLNQVFGMFSSVLKNLRAKRFSSLDLQNIPTKKLPSLSRM